MISDVIRCGPALGPARSGLQQAQVTHPYTLSAALRGAAALLLLAAGIVHAGFAPAHREHLVHVAFFLGAAAFQIGGAFVALRSRSESAVALVIDGNTGIVILWSVSRLVGPVLFPAAAWTEGIGYADALCTALEIGAVALLTAVCRSGRSSRAWRERAVSRPALASALAVVALLLVPLAGHGLSTVGSHHDGGDPVCGSSVCVTGGDGAGHTH